MNLQRKANVKKIENTLQLWRERKSDLLIVNCCFCLSFLILFVLINEFLWVLVRLNGIVGALEFTEGMNWILNFFLRSFPYFGSNFFGFFGAHKGLLFWCFHLPYNDWWLNVNTKIQWISEIVDLRWRKNTWNLYRYLSVIKVQGEFDVFFLYWYRVICVYSWELRNLFWENETMKWGKKRMENLST